MKFYWYKTPWYLRAFYPELTWRIKNKPNAIYLTFDDGPQTGITEYVLGQLDQFQVRSTFFLRGDNAEKNPELLQQILDGGHRIGNHSYHHFNGWHTGATDYLRDFQRSREVFEKLGISDHGLFRPPYGKMTRKQIRFIQKTHKIIMWDLLSGDFDQDINMEKAKFNLRKAEGGTIVVFHDNIHFTRNVKELLPWFLEFHLDRGFKFELLDKNLT